MSAVAHQLRIDSATGYGLPLRPEVLAELNEFEVGHIFPACGSIPSRSSAPRPRSPLSGMEPMARGHGHDRGGSANRATVHTLASEERILDRFAEDVPHRASRRGPRREAALPRPHLAAARAADLGRRQGAERRGQVATWSTRYCASFRARPSTRSPACRRRRSSTPRSRWPTGCIVIFEAAGIAGDGFAPYFLRSLLSEGHLRYETVETQKQGKPKGVVLEREGPTGAILTTTRVKLDPELETRLLSIPVTDSAAQTKAVMLRSPTRTRSRDRSPVARAPAGARRCERREVTIPFARALAEAIPPAATRLRRDFGAILGADPHPRAPTPGDQGLRRAATARSPRSRTTRWSASWSPI